MIFTPAILFTLAALMFISVIFMHLSHKNLSVILWYTIQSLVVVCLLFVAALETASPAFFAVVALVFTAKVVAAPYFFRRLIGNHQLKFSASTYLNMPLTLIVIALLTALAESNFLQPLIKLAPQFERALLLAVAMIFISIFLIVNRRGVLSQMIGVLSLENAVVLFAYLAGLESSPGLQAGMIFDVFIWIVIAVIFASMIYEKFGTLDTSELRNLKEE